MLMWQHAGSMHGCCDFTLTHDRPSCVMVGIGMIQQLSCPQNAQGCMLPTADLRPSMGDPKSDFIVTMHCVVRAAAFGKSSGHYSSVKYPSHSQHQPPHLEFTLHACMYSASV